MKSLVILILFAATFFAAKEKTVIKVNPTYLGTYYRSDSPTVKGWTLKAVTDAPNKIDFYYSKDTELLFTVVMKDSTRFKTPHDYAQSTAGQGTRYWSATGRFMPDGQMEIAVHSSDVSSGLKLSLTIEPDVKVLYTKK